MDTKKSLLRVAIVGFGFMGRMHYGIWKRMKDTEIVALCDKDRSQFTTKLVGNISGADDTVDFGDTPIYEDFEKMLAEVKPDVISLTLPTFLHLPLTKIALAAGVSVLCEKPMALTSDQCQEMLDAAKQAPNGAKLMVAQCVRFWPAFAYIKTLVEEGKYGKLISASFRRLSPPPGWGKSANWFCDEKRSGGIALDLHIHDSDLIQYIFGMPKAVSSHATYHESGAMQYISTLYDVGNVTVTAEGSWYISPTAGFEASYTLVFEKATVIFDGKREKPFYVFPYEGEPFVPQLKPEDGYYYEIEWFRDLLLGKDVPPITSAKQSRDSVRLIEAEKLSAKTGKVVEIKGE